MALREGVDVNVPTPQGYEGEKTCGLFTEGSICGETATKFYALGIVKFYRCPRHGLFQ